MLPWKHKNSEVDYFFAQFMNKYSMLTAPQNWCTYTLTVCLLTVHEWALRFACDNSLSAKARNAWIILCFVSRLRTRMFCPLIRSLNTTKAMWHIVNFINKNMSSARSRRIERAYVDLDVEKKIKHAPRFSFTSKTLRPNNTTGIDGKVERLPWTL